MTCMSPKTIILLSSQHTCEETVSEPIIATSPVIAASLQGAEPSWNRKTIISALWPVQASETMSLEFVKCHKTELFQKT